MKISLVVLVAGLLSAQGDNKELSPACKKLGYSREIIECVRDTAQRSVYCFPEQLMLSEDIELANKCNAENAHLRPQHPPVPKYFPQQQAQTFYGQPCRINGILFPTIISNNPMDWNR